MRRFLSSTGMQEGSAKSLMIRKVESSASWGREKVRRAWWTQEEYLKRESLRKVSLVLSTVLNTRLAVVNFASGSYRAASIALPYVIERRFRRRWNPEEVKNL